MLKYRKDGTIEVDKVWNLTIEDQKEIASIIDDCSNLPILSKRTEGTWVQQGSSDTIENTCRVFSPKSKRKRK